MISFAQLITQHLVSSVSRYNDTSPTAIHSLKLVVHLANLGTVISIQVMFIKKLPSLFLLITLRLLLENGPKSFVEGAKKRIQQEDVLAFKRKYHKLLELSQKGIKRLVNLNDYERFYNDYLQKILRVRVPGTVGHREVKQFIIKTLKDLEWDVKIDEFENSTPLGMRKFTNIIATLDPKAERRLVLAAHYDSKLMAPVDGKYFKGATDSAVPCAMMLDLAHTLHDKLKNRQAAKNVSLQLFFLDGEEAFVEWNEKDSIYGARHLADVLAKKPHHKKEYSSENSMLDAIDAFVLLDLIGASNPQFFDLYENTSHLYKSLQLIEKNLGETKQLEKYSEERPYFVGKPQFPLYIEDDHLPFLKKNVPVMHLITVPFPSAWHKITDDETILDQASIENMLKIMRIFVAQYLHLK